MDKVYKDQFKRNYKTKEFRIYLSKDKKFADKLKSCQRSFTEEELSFFSNIQSLIGYTSFRFLSSLIIFPQKLKDEFFKINSMAGDINAIKTLNLLCRVINRMDLFYYFEETYFNDYANVDKHAKIYEQFDRESANTIVNLFNEFMGELNKINKFVDIENCIIPVDSDAQLEYKTGETISEKKVINSKQSSQFVRDFIDGKIGLMTISAVYDTLNEYDKFVLMTHFADECDKKYDGEIKQIVRIGGNDWFICIKKASKENSYKSGFLWRKTNYYYNYCCHIFITLLRKKTDYTKIKISADDGGSYSYSIKKPKSFNCSLGETIAITDNEYDLLSYSCFKGEIEALNMKDKHLETGNKINFYIEGKWENFGLAVLGYDGNSKKSSTKLERPIVNATIKQYVTEVTQNYLDGKVGNIVFNAIYHALSEQDKVKVMSHIVETCDKQYSGCFKQVVKLYDNDWFICLDEKQVTVCLIRKNNEATNLLIKNQENDNDTKRYFSAIVGIPYCYKITSGGCWEITEVDIHSKTSCSNKYITFETESWGSIIDNSILVDEYTKTTN